MFTMNFDVIIIGAGPIGLACAIECEKNNLHYLVVEKGKLVNSLEQYPLTMTFFSTPDRLEIGDISFVSQEYRPKRSEAIEYYTKVSQKWNLNVHTYEEVVDVQMFDNGYYVLSSKNKYYTKKVIVATGYYDVPILMNVPGEDLKKVHHYFRDPEDFRNKKVIVVGAANSAIDAVIECERVNAEIILVIRGGEVNGRVKPWVKPNFELIIENGKLRMFTHSIVKEIFEDKVVIHTLDGEKILPNDIVLAMTGYKPNYPFLQKIGIQFEDTNEAYPMCISESHETNMPGMYIAGVVCGGMNTTKFFIENSREHAEKIVQDIIRKLKN